MKKTEVIKSPTTVNANMPNLPALPISMLPSIAALTTALGIPRNVLASDEEIQYAWNDLPRELQLIPAELSGELIARMCIAVSTGLFDGAMNYIWNAAILHLRDKTRNFGLPVVAQILQKNFEKKHLLELQDNQLLELSLKLNLISEDGFFFLDQCRDTRNNFSAAHPTLGKVNDREFTVFLNRCIKYALAETTFPKGVDITAFISAIKRAKFTSNQCQVWTERLSATHDAQRQMLIGTVHGIYCDPKTPQPARLNSLDICAVLKEGFSSSLRSDLINKHSEYVAIGDNERYKASQQFFEKLGLIGLLNKSERHAIFSKAINNLLNIHKGMDNFYNEPPFAKRLLELSKQEKIPKTAQEQYVVTVLMCFVGNVYGFSWDAIPSYTEMIKEFSTREISIMIPLAKNPLFKTRITSSADCKKRLIEAIKLIDPASVPSPSKTEYEVLIKEEF